MTNPHTKHTKMWVMRDILNNLCLGWQPEECRRLEEQLRSMEYVDIVSTLAHFAEDTYRLRWEQGMEEGRAEAKEEFLRKLKGLKELLDSCE